MPSATSKPIVKKITFIEDEFLLQFIEKCKRTYSKDIVSIKLVKNWGGGTHGKWSLVLEESTLGRVWIPLIDVEDEENTEV